MNKILKCPYLSHPAWNKGKTKFSDPRIAKYGKTYHNRLQSGQLKFCWTGRKLTDEHRINISKGMKKAHLEGRAHNIGQSRWNNEPSYPEKFFTKVINRNFSDKNYKREFPFKIYSLDFAWPEKRLCIEIDGDQHQRFYEYKQRDIRKDKCLNNAGWEVLRIPWKTMFHDPKNTIKTAKLFIDEFEKWWLNKHEYSNFMDEINIIKNKKSIKIGQTEFNF